MAASVERSRSVSSIRSSIVPPWGRGERQLNKAVRAPPMCRKPVGEGAKRVTTAGASEVALKRIFSKDAAVGIVDASAPIIADRPRQTRAGAAFRALSERFERLADAERDQLPLWLPVGLGLGTAAWFALPEATGWEAFLCLCAAFGLA